MDLETVFHFGIPNHWKIRNRCSKWLPRDSPNHPKITKNLHLDLQVPVGWPLGSLDHQNGVPGTQNGASRSPKWQFYVKKVTHLSSQPVSSCLLTGGRWQGRSLQIYIYIYIYIRHRAFRHFGVTDPCHSLLSNLSNLATLVATCGP